MAHRMTRRTLVAAIIGAALCAGAPAASAGPDDPCTDQFTAAVSDAWANASNWSAGVPTASTVACWSGVTVVVSSGSQTAGTIEATDGGGLTVTGGSLDVTGGQSPVVNLTLSGGTLSGAFGVTGAFSWTGGTLDSTVIQTGGGAASISGSAPAVLGGGLSTTSPLSITNPNVTASLPSYGEPGLTTTGTMSFGPGVTIASGNATPGYAAASIATNAGPTYGFSGPYTLTLSGGATTTIATGTTFSSGSSGAITMGSGTATDLVLDVDGTLNGSVTVPQDLEGELIEGSGTIDGDVSIAGGASVQPGDPIGTLTIDGNLTQTDGSVVIDVGGTTSGSGYSVLDVAGVAKFYAAPASGEFYGSQPDFMVRAENGFAPAVADSFDVVTSPGGVGDGFENGTGGYPVIAYGAGNQYGMFFEPDALVLKPVPGNTTIPAITGASGGDSTPDMPTGIAYVGDTLTCGSGAWSNDPTAYTYSWSSPSFGTAPTHLVVPADVGATVACNVSATNANGTGYTASSESVSIEASPGVPTNIVRPAIAGNAVEGDTLSEISGTWRSGGATLSIAEQWLRCTSDICVPIAGATADRYTLSDADVGSTIKVVETASDSDGAGVPAVSQPTATVAAAPTSISTALNPPGTELLGAKITKRTRTITVRLAASGTASGFECALVRVPAKHHGKAERPDYKPCGKSVSFKHLAAGRYELYLRAVGPGGVDPKPLIHRFEIA